MSYYPILFKLDNKLALVAGGGKVARRKVETLLEFGASVNVVARELVPELQKLADDNIIRLVGDEFMDYHLDDTDVVIAATDDAALNHKIAATAQKRGLLVNAVDQPADCNFIVPSIMKRGDLLIAISTSGRSPALAKAIREKLEGEFGFEYAIFVTLMGHLRKEILAKGLSQGENNHLFTRIVQSDTLNAISHDDWEGVRSTLSEILPENINIKDTLNKLY